MKNFAAVTLLLVSTGAAAWEDDFSNQMRMDLQNQQEQMNRMRADQQRQMEQQRLDMEYQQRQLDRQNQEIQRQRMMNAPRPYSLENELYRSR